MPYVTLAQVRALPNLSDPAKFTDDEISAAIEWFETTFEEYTGVAWVERTVTGERHDGGSRELILDHLYPREITAVRVFSTATASTAFTVDELADLRRDDSGIVSRVTLGGFAAGSGNIEVDYTHYKTEEPPADVVDAALVAIRDHLLDDHTGHRTLGVQTQDGIIRSSLPSPALPFGQGGSTPGRPFGIPRVDTVANNRRQRAGGFA